jgi:hypothetical protein
MEFDSRAGERSGVAPPPPSLLTPLFGHIKATEEHLLEAVGALTNIGTWDANTTNHTGIHDAVEELRRTHDDWHRGMLTHLQSLWFNESAVYNDYRQRMDRTLTVRHRAELEHAFPRLKLGAAQRSARAQESESDVLARVGGSMEHLQAATHATDLGFDFDAANSRLQLLLARQLNERAVFNRTVLRHTERLIEAKRIDVAKLKALLDRTEKSLEAMFAVVEKAIAASHQLAQTDKLYASTVGRGSSVVPSARGSRPATGNSALRPSRAAPAGSAMDA